MFSAHPKENQHDLLHRHLPRSSRASPGAPPRGARPQGPAAPSRMVDPFPENGRRSRERPPPMARTRAKSPPRLTRDAERLIALALGLNASGSLTEDRFWESEMSALVAKLLENGNDAPLDGALDHLYQTNLGAYDTLIELVENESESVVVMQGDRAWQGLLIAAPIVAWSKYSIPSGPIARDEADTLKVHLLAHVLAA